MNEESSWNCICFNKKNWDNSFSWKINNLVMSDVRVKWEQKKVLDTKLKLSRHYTLQFVTQISRKVELVKQFRKMKRGKPERKKEFIFRWKGRKE